MSYLAAWYDPALKIKPDESADSIGAEERARLTKLVVVAGAAHGIPRRIGTEATGEELAADKRRCKRIGHVASQCLTGWGGPVNNIGDVSREAAQVEWQRWYEGHRTWLENRIRYISTWSQQIGGDEKWAKSAVVRLTNELRWLEYAMR